MAHNLDLAIHAPSRNGALYTTESPAAYTPSYAYERILRMLPLLTPAERLRLIAHVATAIEQELPSPRRTAAEMLANPPSGRAFRDAAEVHAYLAEERAAWDD